ILVKFALLEQFRKKLFGQGKFSAFMPVKIMSKYLNETSILNLFQGTRITKVPLLIENRRGYF
ncbi:TPA: hypothetical protein ACNTXM_005044, partial [Escherichia coli]